MKWCQRWGILDFRAVEYSIVYVSLPLLSSRLSSKSKEYSAGNTVELSSKFCLWLVGSVSMPGLVSASPAASLNSNRVPLVYSAK